MGREEGGGVRMGDTCTPVADSCQCVAKPPQYCKVVSLQLKQINLKNKKKSLKKSSNKDPLWPPQKKKISKLVIA